VRCAQYTDAGMYMCMQEERDFQISGSYGHYKLDAQTYADWEVECKCFPSNIFTTGMFSVPNLCILFFCKCVFVCAKIFCCLKHHLLIKLYGLEDLD